MMEMQPDELQAWLTARLPASLMAAQPDIQVYPDEVLITLYLSNATLPANSGEQQRNAELDFISQQRENSRPMRMKLARQLQKRLGKTVSWGMQVGESSVLFTTRTTPVMTRLGRAEREVLDTLVAAGVAETRSSALAYTVRTFAFEHADWLAEVREAIEQVEQVRSRLNVRRREGMPMHIERHSSDSQQDDDQDT
jgi:hypothetical protein